MGLVFGGLLTELGWRWTFLLPVPIAAALLAAVPRVLPRDIRGVVTRRAFDVPGAAALTFGMLALVWSVVEAPERGWGDPVTVGGLALAAALLAGFVAIERRSRTPLVRLGMLRSGSLVRANLGAMALFGGYIGFQFIMTLYLQATNGWSALETSLAFLPAGLLVAFGAPRIGPLVDRFGTAPLIAAGALASVAGYALVLRFDAVPDYAAVLLPTVLLIGVGFALGFPTLNMQATNGIADHEQGVASGLVQTSFQVGGAIALAVVSALVTARAGASTDPSVLLDAYRTGLLVSVAVAGAGLLVASSALVRTGAREPVTVAG
jgi:predicted MFS family arabinose efflux permease